MILFLSGLLPQDDPTSVMVSDSQSYVNFTSTIDTPATSSQTYNSFSRSMEMDLPVPPSGGVAADSVAVVSLNASVADVVVPTMSALPLSPGSQGVAMQYMEAMAPITTMASHLQSSIMEQSNVCKVRLLAARTIYCTLSAAPNPLNVCMYVMGILSRRVCKQTPKLPPLLPILPRHQASS